VADSKVASGAAALILGALLLAGCRTNAQGLGERDGQAPPPPVGRPDLAPGPGGGAVADASGPGPVPSPTPPPSGPETDAAPTAADAAPLLGDAASPPPDISRPLADATAGAVEAAGPPPTWLGPDIRAKEIQADTVTAKVIYAKEIDAEEAKLETLIETKDDKRWEMGGADTKISVVNLMAETIYVEKLHCRRVEARQLYAEVVKIQRR
jgi:hypothetical protein